jgi:hypothetical protein
VIAAHILHGRIADAEASRAWLKAAAARDGASTETPLMDHHIDTLRRAAGARRQSRNCPTCGGRGLHPSIEAVRPCPRCGAAE